MGNSKERLAIPHPPIKALNLYTVKNLFPRNSPNIVYDEDQGIGN